MKNILLILLLFIFSNIYAQNIPILSHNNINVEELFILNSTYRETNLSISPDGQFLYFFSSRGGKSWSYAYYTTYKGKSQYDGDIWYSQKKYGRWLAPKCLNNVVNTSVGEDEPNISPDGQYVVFQSWRYSWKTTDGPYYKAERSGNNWTNPKGLGGNIHKFFMSGWSATDGMSISPDNNTFLVACGSSYSKNMNIYYSQKTNEEWSYPQQLSLNTSHDERSVFIAGDGKTIFFASDGYGGYGGLDIFKATLGSNGKCTNIVNIGKPFNTAQDDYGFIITASGKEAYFVRNGDIFFADLIDVDARLIPKPTVVITGVVKDCDNKKPISSYLELIYVNTNKVVSTSKSDYNTGEYSFAIPENSGKYKIINAKDKEVVSTFVINKTNSYQKIVKNIKVCTGSETKQGRKE